MFTPVCAEAVSVYPKRSGALCSMNLKRSGKGGTGARVHSGRRIGSVHGEIRLSATGEMRADKEIIK